MSPRSERDPDGPWFTGITTYQDELGRFTFRHPSDWPRAELEDDRQGVIIGPEPDDPETHFAVWVSKLPEAVVQADLPVLAEGFDAGLAKLPDVVIESAKNDNFNDIVRLERYLTFSDGGQTRRRRMWAMYAAQWQLLIVYQGSSVEEFDYWEAMANYCFSSFELPEELWFATDPELRARFPGESADTPAKPGPAGAGEPGGSTAESNSQQ